MYYIVIKIRRGLLSALTVLVKRASRRRVR